MNRLVTMLPQRSMSVEAIGVTVTTIADAMIEGGRTIMTGTVIDADSLGHNARGLGYLHPSLPRAAIAGRNHPA
jgi:hypothetical protein